MDLVFGVGGKELNHFVSEKMKKHLHHIDQEQGVFQGDLKDDIQILGT